MVRSCYIVILIKSKKVLISSFQFPTSFQSPGLSQKHVRNVCFAAHQYLTKFHFESTQDSKEISISVTTLFHYAYDDITDFEILEFHKNKKIWIFQERNNIFFQIKQENAVRCNSRDNLLQLSFSSKISIFSEAYI